MRDFDAIDQGPFVQAIAGDYMTSPIRCLRDSDSILDGCAACCST